MFVVNLPLLLSNDPQSLLSFDLLSLLSFDLLLSLSNNLLSLLTAAAVYPLPSLLTHGLGA